MSGAAASNSSSSQMAKRRWLLENSVETLNAADNIFKFDAEEQQMIRTVKPWEKDAQYFKEVKISALALLKMVMHARSGGNLEIMGLMQGKVDANTLIVMDVFALPVEGTETRVNAQAQAYEFMTTYTEMSEPVGRLEKVVGWYHSHPGYGCWLSGIDVATQMLNQQFQEPFLAIVVDPIRTISAGRVDIGAFRTFPKGYRPADDGPSEYQSIPIEKIEDFGVHCKQYYPLEITYFMSSLDSKIFNTLWNTHWVNTIAANPLVTNHSYITGLFQDLGAKLGQVGNKNSTMFRERLGKATQDAKKLGCDVLVQGLMGQFIKYGIFSGPQAQALTKSSDATKSGHNEKPSPTKPLVGIDNISVNANALVEEASMKNADEEDKNKIVDDPRPSNNNNNNENAEIPMEQ